jgi:hypothetical protein
MISTRACLKNSLFSVSLPTVLPLKKYNRLLLKKNPMFLQQKMSLPVCLKSREKIA